MTAEHLNQVQDAVLLPRLQAHEAGPGHFTATFRRGCLMEKRQQFQQTVAKIACVCQFYKIIQPYELITRACPRPHKGFMQVRVPVACVISIMVKLHH